MADSTRIEPKPTDIPAQEQSDNPGAERKMDPEPQYMNKNYKGSGLLKDKVALISGADSGIGRAVAILFAREGCKGVAIIYHKQDKDAETTKGLVEAEGSKGFLLKGDIGQKKECEDFVHKVVEKFGQLDILVNHAGVQFYHEDLRDITEKELEKTFRTNVYGYFFLTQAALPHLKKGAAIVNTTSVVAYRGNDTLMDYASTKGANATFTYSLAHNLADKGIRVNAVAPGPIWTPFIPGSFPADKVKGFGKDTPMGRPGQPEELAPAYVFLASELCSSYITGQTIHVNGGTPNS
jgi:NAD(P)-dependent dehydrogenase (short-subunit alcohol dehydrogenase family)